MAKPLTVLDAVCECLQIIQELPPEQRELVITTLDHIKSWSLKALKCPPAESCHVTTGLLGKAPFELNDGEVLAVELQP